MMRPQDVVKSMEDIQACITIYDVTVAQQLIDRDRFSAKSNCRLQRNKTVFRVNIS